MDLNAYLWCALGAVVSFACSFVLTKFGIPYLKKKRMGQTILEIGPEWHKKKEGTPTMGGIFFVLAFVFVLAAAIVLKACFSAGEVNWGGVCVIVFALLNALIGFVDDYVKFMKHRNKGLSALQKLVGQFASAALFLLGMHFSGAMQPVLVLPFGLGEWNFSEYAIVYYFILMVFLVLVVNAVNLTDGLDGLAASTMSVVLLFFVLIAAVPEEGLIASAVFGGLLAFLCFNRHPAKIFMGDTGSLFLGAVLSGLAVLRGLALVLVFAGFVFLFEALSVVLQVGFFKLTHGRRLFKMAPFHHHLEKCGLTENKIVALFSLVTLVGCVLSYFAF